MFRGATIWCVILLMSVVVHAQRESRWTWTSNNRNSIDGPVDRQSDRRKFETVEDFRDRYEVNDLNEQTTRKPMAQSDDFYGNGGGVGFNGPNSVNGNGINGYNGNSFGAFPPQGLGAPNNFNYPPYGNGQFNPGFGGPNNFRPGSNNNFYPNNNGFTQNFGSTPYYPGGFGPNRYSPFNPLGNNINNGILVGPGGPTGIYGRPPNYVGPSQPFGGAGIGPGFNNGFNNGYNNGLNYNNFGPPFGANGPIPFNSNAGAGISAESDDDQKSREINRKSNK